jgi:ketosteroid isomerase-like protein
LSEYERALAIAGESAGKLAELRCATDDHGTLVPSAQLDQACQELWTRHFANAQGAIESNQQVRLACPDMKIESLGSVAPRISIEPKSVESSKDPGMTSGAPAPTVASMNRPDEPGLTNARVEEFLTSQTASFRDVGAFLDAFADSAIVFFPGSLTPYEGTAQIANGFREAWGTGSVHTEIAATPAAIGLVGSAAVVTTEWRITYGTSSPYRVRVTQLIESRAGSLKILAAHFSIPPGHGTTTLGEPAPAFATAGRNAAGGILVGSPVDLAAIVHDAAWTSAIGSDENEFAVGADAVRKMLGGWKKVNLEMLGNARIVEGDGYRAVFGFARWRTSKPTLFRMLGIFVRDDVPTARWELATVHYSVGVPLD